MKTIPRDIDSYISLEPWWRTEVPTEVVLSANGVRDILEKLEAENKKPFFVIDKILEDQPVFAPLFSQDPKFVFNASESEPRTGDVDRLVEHIRSLDVAPDVLVGTGGGATMDLAKATGICLANPASAQEYQGYGLDMKKGADIWVLPTLNGTGAEITPIAVLRGPEKKLGINNPYTEPSVAVVDPQLSSGAKKFNRFFTMMDCYCHHYEIMKSRTSAADALRDAEDGLRLCKEVLSTDLTEHKTDNAIKSAMASILGGSSTIGGRVGAAHAISYGLSNSGPTLPHSVAVTISILAMEDLYPDGYEDAVEFLRINNMPHPRAADYGIDEGEVEKMTNTAIRMDKLWHSYFGDGWESRTTRKFIENIYRKIVQ